MGDTLTARLDAQARARFARQISLPEIGERGQARLCAHAVALGSSAGERVAALYLERAGLHVDATGTPVPEVKLEPCILGELDADARLSHARAWLEGSLRAVEAMKLVISEEKDETS